MRALFVVLVMCRVASASPDVTWQAPAQCPDRDALLAAIAQRLEMPIGSVELAATIEVEATAEGFVAHVHTSEARELASANCAELVAAVAVVVARDARDKPRPVVAALPTRVAAESRAAVEVERPRAVLPTAWNFGARVGGIAGSGDVPSFGIGGELAAFATWRSFSFEVAGSTWRSSSASSGTNASVDVGSTALALRVGGSTGQLRAWTVIEAGRVSGEGVGLVGDGSARSLAVGAGVGYAVPLLGPQLRAVLAGEALVAIDRVAFELASGDMLYQTPAVAFRARLGLEVSWR